MGDPSPSPPAPLDLGRLETEARANAAKHVSSRFQRPEQLEKVDQYKRRVARKKASVEAMLKTAVQSQLDGVRTGLHQLQSALQNVYEIKKSMDEIDESYKSITSLEEKLKRVREENSNFCQLAAAVENLKHIFQVPESVRKTQELINEGKLLQAHKHLMDLEMARDDLLMELHRQPQQSPTDKNTLKHYFADVEKLSEAMGKQLWLILQRALISVRQEPTIIVTVIRIIEREERIDAAALKKHEQFGFLPPGRPKQWRKKAFEVLEEAIAARIEGNQLEDRTDNKMWLVRHLEITRKFMIEDFKVVKTLFPPIFPPDYDIVKLYVRMYHRCLSAHLKDLIQQQLEGNEIITLLIWLNSYDSPELMKDPELNFDTKDLGPLLENNVVEMLQDEFLKNKRKDIIEWTHNALKSDEKDWYKEKLPDKDKDQYYNTPLALIIIDMVDQNLKVAEIVSADLVKKVLQLFVENLSGFANEYKFEMKVYKEKHLGNRRESIYFPQYMICHVNNCLAFADYVRRLRKLFLELEGQEQVKGEEEEDDAIMIRKDQFFQLADKFIDVGEFGLDVLVEVVLLDLRTSGHLDSLISKQWLTGDEVVNTICVTLEDYNNDFQHLRPKAYDKVIEKAEQKVLQEYLKSILQRKISFKNYEERKAAAEKICKEAEQLENLFSKLTTTKSKDSFAVLTMLAEVIRLRDTSMMSLEITGLAKKFPDMRRDQLINLLLSRGDLSRSEAQQLVRDTLGDEQLRAREKGVFSDILN